MRSSSYLLVKFIASVLGSDKSIYDLLHKYEFDNSGVNIEPYIPTILYKLNFKEKREIDQIIKQEGDADALMALSKRLHSRKGSQAAKYLVDRLVSVVRYAASDFPLSVKSTALLYQPFRNKVLYQVHMRSPIVNNGYVSRSKVVINSILGAGYEVVGATRPGFPNELQKYRDEKIARQEIIEGVKFYALRDNGNDLRNAPIDKFIESYSEKIVEMARVEKPEIIHAASNYINGIASILAARKIGIKSVYEVRGMWHITRESREPKYSKTIKYALEEKMELCAANNADRVIAISQGLKDYLVNKGVHENKITVVPNGVDCEQFVPAGRNVSLANELNIKVTDVVIGYIGSLVDYEGLDIVLQAVSVLVERGVSGIKLLIVGGGVEADNLKRIAQSLGIEEICVFTGVVPNEEVSLYYSLVDIAPFVRKELPVTKIVPPLKPMEAMAMGCCVVVSDLPALTDIGENGVSIFQCPSDNHSALAEILSVLVSSEETRINVGNKSREWVSENRALGNLSNLIRRSYE